MAQLPLSIRQALPHVGTTAALHCGKGLLCRLAPNTACGAAPALHPNKIWLFLLL